MAKLKVDFQIIRGDSKAINFEMIQDGEVTDLTDTTVFFTAKPALTNDVTDETAVITKEVTVHSDPTAGKTVINLTPTDTDVTPGEYYYDFQIKRDSVTITSIPARKLEIVADVTRRTS